MKRRKTVFVLNAHLSHTPIADRALYFYALNTEAFNTPVPAAIGEGKKAAIALSDSSHELLDLLCEYKRSNKKDLINAALSFGASKGLFRLWIDDPQNLTPKGSK